MQVDPNLQTHIHTLSDLYTRLQSLRQIPLALLKLPNSDPLSPSPQTLRGDFQQLKDISEIVCSKSAQAAFQAARDSLKADSTDLAANSRRENRKRRRPPSPESPRPYIALEPKGASLFPASDGPPLRADELPEYIRQFNREHQSKLHIWRRTRGGTSTAPIVLRFRIPDVLTAYIVVDSAPDSALIVESLSTFSPRERKAPHSQSDYVVYQSLSQELAKMLQSDPRVPVQGLMSLLRSYSGIFIERCGNCERVLSAEGHVPPVVRVWGVGVGGWEARHVSCRRG